MLDIAVPHPEDDVDAVAARKVLLESGYSVIRSVKCRVTDDRLVLTGEVPSYYMKQIAQTLVIGVIGEMKLENLLRVREIRGSMDCILQVSSTRVVFTRDMKAPQQENS